MSRSRGVRSVVLLMAAGAAGGCGATTTTTDLTSLLSSLTGMTITDSTTIGEILNQLTIGDVVNAYQHYASSVVNAGGGRVQSSLTSDQISQIEDLQAQLDAGTIDQATFESNIQEIIGDALPRIGHAGGRLGGPFGMGAAGPPADPLNLNYDQRTAAQAIFTQLKTDIETLRTTAQQQILALLTDDQKTQLASLGLSKLSPADRPGGGPGFGGPRGPGHHGSLGMGDSSTGDQRYLDLLATKINLTHDQKTSIQAILDTLRASIQTAHDKADTDFRALLTAEQIATLDALRAATSATVSSVAD